jgi:hypothetical protein
VDTVHRAGPEDVALGLDAEVEVPLAGRVAFDRSAVERVVDGDAVEVHGVGVEPERHQGGVLEVDLLAGRTVRVQLHVGVVVTDGEVGLAEAGVRDVTHLEHLWGVATRQEWIVEALRAASGCQLEIGTRRDL